METIIPFADGETVMSIDGLTIENGSGEILVYGELCLAKDKRSLRRAKALATVLADVVKALENAGNLPEVATRGAKGAPDEVANPFL